ncbi:MAG: RHS repeat protein, partial [Ruminococcaceae bacterium]|nr:RHS repeat protein [Oscillospiraceae bacterium]
MFGLFAKICDALPKDIARIKVNVNYYQGSGNPLDVHPYYFDFQKGSDAWQFVCGTFDTTAGDVVHSIDIYCEFSSIGIGCAMFDNISVFQSGIDEFEECLYYGEADGVKNGLLRYKKSSSYYEAYDYDNNKNLIRVANNMGEIHDYEYDAVGNVTREIYYKFKDSNNLPLYPFLNNNPEDFITKTPQTVTLYSYNTYGLLTETDTYEAQYDSNGMVVAKPNAKHIKSNYTYNLDSTSRIFGSLASEINSRGITTWYYYNNKTGYLLATINKNKGTGVSYTYDALGNITSVTPATYTSNTSYSSVSNAEKVDYTYDVYNRLSTIATESTTYYFNYDAFGNSIDISAGDRELASYTYNPNNGKLATMTYGNGTSVRYVYDELDNIKEIWYNTGGNEVKAYEYSYTWLGQVARFDDLVNGTSTIYTYDGSGRLSNVNEYDTADMKNNLGIHTFYNELSQISSVSCSLDYICPSGITNTSLWYNYSYMSDGSLDYVSVNVGITGGKIDYSYDAFNRITSKKYSYTYDHETDYVNNVTYSYAPGVYDNTTLFVSGYTSNVNGSKTNYSYTYDNNGNIEHVYVNHNMVYRYKYDDLGQLVREDNEELNRTYVYTYDNAGNILTKKTYALTAEGSTPTNPLSTVNYGYNDASWGDLLTSYGGQNITYDAIGNPLSYYNGSSYTFTWKQGRRLATAVKGSNTLSFEYNDEGIRVSKTVNGVKHYYHLNGSQIAYEEWGNNILIYLYDADGSPIGMQYRNSTYADGN